MYLAYHLWNCRTTDSGKITFRIYYLNKEKAFHSLNFDVRDRNAVKQAVDSIPNNWRNIDILINNAGLAAGSDPLQDGNMDDWDQMIDTNVKGLLYVTKNVFPLLLQSSCPHIVNIGSIAGKQVYAKGNVYCATKFAVDALTQAMRIDMLSYGIKVSQVAPGAAETEFSPVRFKGDMDAVANVYKGYAPLQAEDIATQPRPARVISTKYCKTVNRSKVRNFPFNLRTCIVCNS